MRTHRTQRAILVAKKNKTGVTQRVHNEKAFFHKYGLNRDKVLEAIKHNKTYGGWTFERVREHLVMVAMRKDIPYSILKKWYNMESFIKIIGDIAMNEQIKIQDFDEYSYTGKKESKTRYHKLRKLCNQSIEKFKDYFIEQSLDLGDWSIMIIAVSNTSKSAFKRYLFSHSFTNAYPKYIRWARYLNHEFQ